MSHKLKVRMVLWIENFARMWVWSRSFNPPPPLPLYEWSGPRWAPQQWAQNCLNELVLTWKGAAHLRWLRNHKGAEAAPIGGALYAMSLSGLNWYWHTIYTYIYIFKWVHVKIVQPSVYFGLLGPPMIKLTPHLWTATRLDLTVIQPFLSVGLNRKKRCLLALLNLRAIDYGV